jgi:hypothetical protein
MYHDHCLNQAVVALHIHNLFLLDVVAPPTMKWDQLGPVTCSVATFRMGDKHKQVTLLQHVASIGFNITMKAYVSHHPCDDF